MTPDFAESADALVRDATVKIEEVIESLYDSTYTQNLGPTVLLDNQEVIMMGAVNYLGLSHHPKVIQATISAIESHGVGGLGSRYSNGCLTIHADLERQCREFLKKSSCLFFNSGYVANLGAFQAFGNDAVVFSDKENHLSLYDAGILSRLKYFRFRHNDFEHLDRLLQRHRHVKNKWVVIVGTFGATGDNVNLVYIVRVAKKNGCRIYLDDAHSIGIYGDNKIGLSDKFGLMDSIDLLMTSFQMAFGSVGAVVAGDTDLINKIKYYARSYIFTYTLPAHAVAGLQEAIQIVDSDEGTRLVENLLKNATILRGGIKKLGLSPVADEHHIVSVRVENEEKAIQLSKNLLNEGVWVQKYIHPSVPLGRPTIRFTTMATHTPAHLEKTLDALEKGLLIR